MSVQSTMDVMYIAKTICMAPRAIHGPRITENCKSSWTLTWKHRLSTKPQADTVAPDPRKSYFIGCQQMEPEQNHNRQEASAQNTLNSNWTQNYIKREVANVKWTTKVRQNDQRVIHCCPGPTHQAINIMKPKNRPRDATQILKVKQPCENSARRDLPRETPIPEGRTHNVACMPA